MTGPPLLTVNQVAERLSIRTHGVLTLIKTGQLLAHDISLTPGGRPTWRIDPKDLEAFMLRRQHQVAPPRRARRRKPKPTKQYF